MLPGHCGDKDSEALSQLEGEDAGDLLTMSACVGRDCQYTDYVFAIPEVRSFLSSTCKHEFK